MTTLLTPAPSPASLPSTRQTMADLLDRLGGISPERVLLDPPPGQATEADVVRVGERDRRLYELVEGTLVEKAVGLRESILAGAILALLRAFVVPRNLGFVSGEAGTMRLFQGLVRMPDVAFVSWGRTPDGRIPVQPVPHLAPDLAVEVLSESNTPAEMARKRREYFESGVRLVWMIDPRDRTAVVYTSPEQMTPLRDDQSLDGGDVLPGFTLSLRDLFAELDRQAGAGGKAP